MVKQNENYIFQSLSKPFNNDGTANRHVRWKKMMCNANASREQSIVKRVPWADSEERDTEKGHVQFSNSKIRPTVSFISRHAFSWHGVHSKYERPVG